MDAEGNAELTFQWTNDTLDTTTYAVSKSGAEVTNQLSDSDMNLYEGAGDNSVTYLSRNDWEEHSQQNLGICINRYYDR